MCTCVNDVNDVGVRGGVDSLVSCFMWIVVLHHCLVCDANKLNNLNIIGISQTAAFV